MLGIKRLILILAVSSIYIGATGCASLSPKSQGTAESSGDAVAQIIRDSKETSGNGNNSANPTMKPAKVASVVTVPVKGKVLKNNKFDYPVVVNPAVEQWIDYFTGKGRQHFEKYLIRSRYFIPTISKILKAHDMPQDLVYLAMIESGFNNVARSRAAAVGPWQFIKSTGKLFGLTINYWIDERRDTRRSTLASINYLKKLYQEFGSWEVASASYNAGENKLRSAIARMHTKDFWEISRRRFLRPETRHYVPKIMAAAILAKNPELFGFEDPFNGTAPNPTLAFDDTGSSEVTPKELGEEAMAAETSAEEDVADVEVADEEDEEASYAAFVPQTTPSMSSSVFMVANPNEQIMEFEVKGPADLFSVSKAAGIPFSTVKLLNPELLRWCTPPHLRTYRVKLPLSAKENFLKNYNDEGFDRKVTFAQYKVRPGDTVTKVAQRFTVQPDPIRELNKLGDRSNSLRAGSEIMLPIPTGYKRIIASMYDEKPMPARRRRGRRRRSHRRHSYYSHMEQQHVRGRLPTSLPRTVSQD